MNLNISKIKGLKDRFPISGILKLLEEEEDFIFLETARCDSENYLSYIFLRPQKIVSTFKIGEIESCFEELGRALKEGYYVAGFLSYEAGEAFEEGLRGRVAFDFPLLWFGVYKEPVIYDHCQERFRNFSSKAGPFIKKIVKYKNCRQRDYLLRDIRPNISENTYLKAIAKIKDLIAQGFTYQVNYTFKLKFSFSGSASGLFFNLRNNQSVSYSAFIKAGPYFVLSFSPELFFRKIKDKIYTRPMKGTARRGRDLQEDRAVARGLRRCLKNRSENIMIVDLLRNDLGRISATGSVRVCRLFNVEKYQTLFQMTSDIKARLKTDDFVFDIFRYIFPSGSVTGAPKIKTMEIIRQLEKEPRKIYTGSIGFFSPDKSGTFNVAIRTLLINSQTKAAEMAVGSGIVYDSIPEREFEECCLKANFLTHRPQEFQLIETMLWRPDKGYLLIDKHLKRLESSSKYFNFPFNKKDIMAALKKLQRYFKKNFYRVRLLLDRKGNIKLKSSLLKKPGKRPKVCISSKKTRSRNPFLYHKTTNRKIYDVEYKRCKRLGFYDVIFTNEKGEVTEGAISNIFIRKNGKFYTPPINCGVLDGIYRRYLLSSKKYIIKEKVLFIDDLFSADEIYLSNSVRGLVKVYLEDKKS